MPYIPKKLTESDFKYKILSSEINLPKDPDFTQLLPKQSKVPKYFPNPEPNWGPKARAKGKKRTQPEDSKEESNSEKKICEDTN